MGNNILNAPDPLLIVLIIIISIWQLLVKAVALWRAAQFKQRNWFVGLFIIMPLNDLGIIEIIYLFWFAKKRLTIAEVKSWFSRNKT